MSMNKKLNEVLHDTMDQVKLKCYSTNEREETLYFLKGMVNRLEKEAEKSKSAIKYYEIGGSGVPYMVVKVTEEKTDPESLANLYESHLTMEERRYTKGLSTHYNELGEGGALGAYFHFCFHGSNTSAEIIESFHKIRPNNVILVNRTEKRGFDND